MRKNKLIMKTIRKIAAAIDTYLEKKLLNYIDKVTNTLYPKPHLMDDDVEDDDDEPILFI